MHYYSHHIDSYTSATRHLTPMEDLAYRRMLEVYYRDEGPLQGDAAAVARRVGLREFVESVAVVLAEFFTETEAGWRQQRCEEELANYRHVVERNRANGGLGGRPKKPTGFPVGSQSVPSGNPLVTQSKPTGNPPNPNPTPNPTPTPNSESLSPQTPPSPTPLPVASLPFENLDHAVDEPVKAKPAKDALIEAVVATPEFQRFWSAYDLKKGRDEAAKSWGKLAPDQHLAATIVAAARGYAEDNPDKAYRKHPATWLNQKGWLDERVSRSKVATDGGFNRNGKWMGVPRGKQDYSVGLGEDDPEHPKQLLANENGIRASKSLQPLTMDEWKAMGDPRAR